LERYLTYFKTRIYGSSDFKKLCLLYRKQGYIELDCWCINKVITSLEDIDIDKATCHGEIIAFFLLKEVQQTPSL
jgi:hypothetical protein